MSKAVNRYVIVGLVVAPLVGSLALWLVMFVLGGPEATFWLPFMLPAAYGCSLLFGVPAYFVLRRYNLTRFWHYAAAGLLIGLIPALVVWIGERSSETLAWIKILLIFGTILGPLSAIVFWVIAVRRNEQQVGV